MSWTLVVAGPNFNPKLLVGQALQLRRPTMGDRDTTTVVAHFGQTLYL